MMVITRYTKLVLLLFLVQRARQGSCVPLILEAWTSNSLLTVGRSQRHLRTFATLVLSTCEFSPTVYRFVGLSSQQELTALCYFFL